MWTNDLFFISEIEEPREGKARLKEITKGMGESCGSIFLDQRFETLLQEQLGTEISKVSANSMMKMMDQFIDSIKVNQSH